MTNRNRLIFLVKDPHWTFLWWELSPASLRQVIEDQRGDPGQLILRIYDVTHLLFDGQNAHLVFDVELDRSVDHYYLNIWAADRNYLAEIGLRYPPEIFHPLARSHSIYLPREHPSTTGEESWSTIII
jgi:hypothetical protein